MEDVNVGDVIYRAYYFGDDIILDKSRIISISYEMPDLDENGGYCRIEREDGSFHDLKTKRIIDEFSISRIKALAKLLDKHMKVVQKVLEKIECE